MQNHDNRIRVLSRAASLLPFFLLACGSNDGNRALTLDASSPEAQPDTRTGWEAEPDVRQSSSSFDAAGGPDKGGVPLDGGSGSSADSREPLDGDSISPPDSTIERPEGGRDTNYPEVDYVVDVKPKDDRYVTPTNEQTCVQSTGVLPCEAGGTTMLIRAATPETFFLKAEVTSGSCGVAGAPVCYGGCDSLTIFQGISQALGSTCDLLVTFLGGGEQRVHLELVANPSPTSMCCGYPQPPNTGRWVTLDPLRFAPSQVVLGSPMDGGVGDAQRFFDAPMVNDVRPPTVAM